MWLLTPLIRLYYPFFIFLIILGIFLRLSSHSWFIIWIGLEINLYSFIPFLLHSNIQKRKEAAAKYFIAQASGSTLLLTATLTSSSLPLTRSIIFITRLILKAGLAPMHFWFPRTIAVSRWFTCYLLSTVQKIAPSILLISIFQIRPRLILISGGLISIIGGIIGINQTQLRAIIAYSSIGQIGWVISASQVSFITRSLIFINYLISISIIIIIFSHIEINTLNEPNTTWVGPKPLIFVLILLIINLRGIPPFPGFFFKIIIVIKLLYINAIKSTLLLILGSIIRLYFYLKIIFITILNSSNKKIIVNTILTTTHKYTLILLRTTRLFIIFIIFPIII